MSVFLESGGFADEDQSGGWIADAENGLGSSLAELALGAVDDLFGVELGQRLGSAGGGDDGDGAGAEQSIGFELLNQSVSHVERVIGHLDRSYRGCRRVDCIRGWVRTRRLFLFVHDGCMGITINHDVAV